jgi:hypothetical protein
VRGWVFQKPFEICLLFGSSGLCSLVSLLHGKIMIVKLLMEFPSSPPPVGVRIRDAILRFNLPWLEGYLEPDYHFVFF